MSTYFNSSPCFTTEQVILLKEQTPQLQEREAVLLKEKAALTESLRSLNAEIDTITNALNVSKLITEMHLGAPINIHKGSGYSSDVVWKVSNITPSKEQWMKENLAEYTVSKYHTDVKLRLTASHPEEATSVITCPNKDAAHEIAKDFAATGKFPALNKLLCKFKQKENEEAYDG